MQDSLQSNNTSIPEETNEAESDEKEKIDNESEYTINILHVLFPFFGMFYHYMLRMVHNKREFVVFFVAKTVLFLAFLFIALYTWVSQHHSFQVATGVTLIVAPIASIIYSYMIFNMKCMATGRQRPEDADGP